MLALPFFGLGRFLGTVAPPAWRLALAGPSVQAHGIRWGGTLEIFAVSLYAPVASALLCALFFLWQRRLGSSAVAASVATLALGATTYVAMMSVYFLQHTSETLAILGALYAMRRFRDRAPLAWLASGSALASSSVLIRAASVAAAPALAGYALWAAWRRRAIGWVRLAAALALPFLAVVAAHVALNYAKWGSWLSSPMLAHTERMVIPIRVGLAGFLVSPGCSLFVYTPLLLLAPWILADAWRRQRAECAVALASLASFLLVCARYEFWTGLWSSPGPRYLFATVPLLLLGLGPWLDAHPGRAARAAFGTLAALGLAVQIALMAVSWPAVIELMHYREYQPPKAFLFVLDQSPILGALRALRGGWVDAWLWQLGAGWEGRPGTPGVAAALGVAWCVAFGASARAARRALGELASAERRALGKAPPPPLSPVQQGEQHREVR